MGGLQLITGNTFKSLTSNLFSVHTSNHSGAEKNHGECLSERRRGTEQEVVRDDEMWRPWRSWEDKIQYKRWEEEPAGILVEYTWEDKGLWRLNPRDNSNVNRTLLCTWRPWYPVLIFFRLLSLAQLNYFTQSRFIIFFYFSILC